MSTEFSKALGSDRLVRGGLTLVSAQAGKLVIEFLTLITLARLLDPDAFGLLAMAMTATSALGTFRDLGLSTAIIQRAEIDDDMTSSLFWIAVATGTAITIAIATLAPWVATFYSEPRLGSVLPVLALSFLLYSLGDQHQALLKRDIRFDLIGRIEVMASLGSASIGVALAFAGAGYWALVSKQLALPALTTLLAWRYQRWVPSLACNLRKARSLLVFGGHLTLFNIANFAARNVDDILIGRLLGPRVLGFYAEAYRFVMLPLRAVNTPCTVLALPLLSRLRANPDEYRRTFLGILEKVLVATVPFAGIVVAAPAAVLRITLGEQWLPAAPILGWLGLLILVQPFGSSMSWLLVSQGRTSELWRWGLLGAAISTGSFVVGLPWGAAGIAASYSLSGLFLRMPLLLWISGRRGPVRVPEILRCAAPAAFSAGVVFLVATVMRPWLELENPWAAGALLLVPAGLATLLALLAIPRGRRILRQTVDVGLSSTRRSGKAP